MRKRAPKSKRITRAQARSFKRRWAIVNAAEIKELRSTAISRKYHQFCLLMLSAGYFKRPEKLPGEESEVRDRWTRIRRAFHA